MNIFDSDYINPTSAVAELDHVLSEIRAIYYDGYSTTESLDQKHKESFFSNVAGARANALACIPSNINDVPTWIESHIKSLLYVLDYSHYPITKYQANPYIGSFLFTVYKPKYGQNGTLFEGEYGNELITNCEDEDDEPKAVIWGRETESELKQVMRKLKARLCNVGFPRWQLDDWLSWANEQYAELLLSNPGNETSWYAQRLMWMAQKEYRRTKTKKYLDSEEREVEKVFVSDEEFYPVEQITIEHVMTAEQYSEELTKTQLKTWNDCIDWAEDSDDDAPMPKALKQRLKRLPKVDTCTTVERVTRYNDYSGAAEPGWDLRTSTDRDFPVQIKREARKHKATVNGLVAIGKGNDNDIL